MQRFEEISRLIEDNNNFIITAHETPDGDAIGSECAMNLFLERLNKKSYIINADPMAKKYSFLDPDNRVSVLSEVQIPDNLSEYTLLILDTNDIENIGEVSKEILPYVGRYFIIDHHESDDEIISNNLIESNASSTCEIIYDLISSMNVKMDMSIANAIYVGIVYDTGSFIYPKTTAKTFLIAHELVKTGVNPNYIYSKIYESNSISALKLQSKVLSSLELYYGQKVAVQTMLKEDLEECSAHYEESDTLINIPLKSEAIKVSVFFKENEDGILRCSLRSKGNIDVAEIAQSYGGGGHKTAAGFKSKDPLDIIKIKVLDRLKKYFQS